MHTLGPWNYYHEKTGDCFVVEAADGRAIAETFYSSDWNEANARLIAEAPAMLEALEIAKDSVQWMADATDADPEDHERLAFVNEAIRKAKGE